MKKIFLLLICVSSLLSGCSNISANTIIEMQLTGNYDVSDPFVHEKLFYVSDSIDTLNLNISFQMKGEKGILEIADNKTDQVYWSNIWNEDVAESSFSISLNNLAKEKEYVIRFTGTQVQSAKILITSDNKLVKEREKPIKQNKA